jgi:hypothetical protein
MDDLVWGILLLGVLGIWCLIDGRFCLLVICCVVGNFPVVHDAYFEIYFELVVSFLVVGDVGF